VNTQTAFVPLSSTIRACCLEMSAQINSEEADNVNRAYANALAVWAMQRLFQYIGVIEDKHCVPLRVSQHGNTWLRLSNYGSIGCLWICSDNDEVSLPQFDEKYLAYFVVKFDCSFDEIRQCKEAEILGFTSNTGQPVDLNNLEDMNGFFDWVDQYDAQIAPTA
jgi:hypothetical protein